MGEVGLGEGNQIERKKNVGRQLQYLIVRSVTPSMKKFEVRLGGKKSIPGREQQVQRPIARSLLMYLRNSKGSA